MRLNSKDSLGQLGILGHQFKEVFFIVRKVGQFGQVQGHHANGAGQISSAEQPAGFFLLRISRRSICKRQHMERTSSGLRSELMKFLEVGRAVFGGHFEE